jgi:hypothetical protein
MSQFTINSKIRLFFEKPVLQLFFFHVHLKLNSQYSGSGILSPRGHRTGGLNRPHPVLLMAFL